MENVLKFLINKSGINKNDNVVVAVSGGPDSMALLYLLQEVRNVLSIKIIVAHVNHNVRRESEQEKQFLEKYCVDNDIIFEHMKIEDYGEDNFHNEARSIRYNYFDSICTKYQSKFLLTAHHGDDLIETILMRIVRGSTLKGYSGFSKIIERENFKIIRPLISVTKSEIIDYNNAHNIKYVTDQSNEKDVYTRNRYRKYVLPFLKNEDENVHLKFLKFSETLLEYNDYIESKISSLIVKVFRNGVLDIEKFLELEHLFQNKIISNILESIYGDDLLIITDTHVKIIFELINSKRANSVIHLPNNILAIKAYNDLIFKYDDNGDFDEYEIELSDMVHLPNEMIIDKVDCCDWTNNYCIRLNSQEIKLPLYVRTRRTGDKIQVKGMDGRKKVNNIFIEDKIPIMQRNTWPIVCDSSNNIIWIPGLKKSRFDKGKSEEYDIILRYY